MNKFQNGLKKNLSYSVKKQESLFFVFFILFLLHSKVSKGETSTYIEALNQDSSYKSSDPYFLPKCICVVSTVPLYDVFTDFLFHLYNLSQKGTHIPIERIISNFCFETPLPPRGKLKIEYRLNNKLFHIFSPPVNKLPDYHSVFS